VCAEDFRRHHANSQWGVWKACFLNLIGNYISAQTLLNITQQASQNNHRLKVNVKILSEGQEILAYTPHANTQAHIQTPVQSEGEGQKVTS